MTSTAVLIALNLAISARPIDLSPAFYAGTALKTGDRGVAVTDVGEQPDVSTLARPLFSPDRREFVAAAAPVQELEPEAATSQETTPAFSPQVKLLGTRTIHSRQAALLQVEGEDAQWYPAGEMAAGWMVREISTQSVTLSANGEDIVVTFVEGGAHDQ